MQDETSSNLPANIQQTQKEDSIEEEGTLIQLVDGTICGCNGIECLGYNPNEMIGKNLFDLFSQIIDLNGVPYTRDTYPATVSSRTGQSFQNKNTIIGYFKSEPNQGVWLRLNFQPLFLTNDTKPYAILSKFCVVREIEFINNNESNSNDNSQSEQVIYKIYLDLDENNTNLSSVNYDLQAVLEELSVAEAEMQQQNLLLENERQHYVDLFNFAPDGYIVTDIQGKIQEANQSVATFLGLKQQNLIGKNLTAFIPSQEYQALYSQFNQLRALPQLQIQTKELQILPHQGAPFSAEVTVASIYNKTREFTGLRWLIRDITDRKRSTQAVQQSELYFRTLADTMPQLFWTTLPDGYHDYFNRRWFEYTGMTLEQTQGWGWSHLLHPDDQQRCFDIWNESLRTGKIYNIEYRFKRASDGKYRWFIGRAFPLRDKHGKIIRWFGSCTDIDDAKRVEQALRESEERYRILTEIAPQVVWMSQNEGKITYCNQYWLDYSGLSIEQTMGHQWLSVIHPEDREQVLKTWNRAIGNSNNYEAEIRCRRASDGMYRWFIARGLPLRDDSGTIVKWIGVASDIHDRKQAEIEREQLLLSEQAAREQAENANRIKDEFLAVLSHELRTPLNPIIGWVKLLKSGKLKPQKVTEALDTIERNAKLQVDLIEDLLDVSRILRGKLTLNPTRVNIISVISAAIDTVRLAAETKNIQIQSIGTINPNFSTKYSTNDQNSSIYTGTESGTLEPNFGTNIGTINANSSVNTGTSNANLSINPGTSNASSSVNTGTSDANSSINTGTYNGTTKLNFGTNVGTNDTISGNNKTNLSINTDKKSDIKRNINIDTVNANSDTNLVLVTGDAARLQQIFWNLLSNAIKFTPNGGQVKVCLSIEIPFIKVTVSDTGKGINPDFLPDIFDYFRQEDSTTTRKFGGLGLGLAIVRNLVELHGGTVEAYSPGLNQGATFTVKLPLLNSVESKVLSAEILSLRTQHSELSTQHSLLSNIRVLAVDDDQDSRDFIAFALELYGAQVTKVSSAIEALQVLAHLKPHILVSDIGMPIMDGYELLRQIRKWAPENGGLIPAIALTAFAGEYNRQKVLDAGFVLHIPKPVEPDTLATAIASLIK